MKNGESWYQSRRIWAAILSLIAVIFIVIAPQHYDVVAIIGGIIASGLGLTSWNMPKKN